MGKNLVLQKIIFRGFVPFALAEDAQCGMFINTVFRNCHTIA